MMLDGEIEMADYKEIKRNLEPKIEAKDPLMEGVDKENLTFKKSGYY